ncbi:MAG TPA: YciI family protein [Nitrospiraceae bacterium]|nr:YciI family protein [Nitrospiraceae bacterium]
MYFKINTAMSIIGPANDYPTNRESLMQYMLLVHHDEEAFIKIDETRRQQMLDESVQLTHQLHASNQYVSASPLHPAATAAIVRVRDGQPTVTDGPFIETKEQLAGYFLINAKDLNEAVRIATRVPGARIGTVEVRPVKEIAGLPTSNGIG